MFEELEKIIKNKWEKLEKEEKESVREKDEELKKSIKSSIMKLNAYKDFKIEYKLFKRDLGKILFTEEEENVLLFNFFQKWSFIFVAILNLDISNTFLLSFTNECLMELLE
jgi:hypothetical protein